MQSQAIVPRVTTSRLRETRASWIGQLGFQLSYDHTHYFGVRSGPKGAWRSRLPAARFGRARGLFGLP